MEFVVGPIHRISPVTGAAPMRGRRVEPGGLGIDADPFERTDAAQDAPFAVASLEVVDIAKARDQIVLGTAVLAGIVMARLPVRLTLCPPRVEIELVDEHIADEVLTPRVAGQ